MLKYSTYRSIFNENQEEHSAANVTINGFIDRLQENANRLGEGLKQLVITFNMYKLIVTLLLIASGFAVVGNVFAGPVNEARQEKRIVVERGDTLWSIARENKPENMRTAVYIEGIKQYSHLSDSNIQAGDILTVPVY